MPDDPIELKLLVLHWRRLAVIATAFFGLATITSIAVFAPMILELEGSAQQTSADIARLALEAQTCQEAGHRLGELQVKMAKIEAESTSTRDYTAEVTADDLFAMVDCAASCVEEPRGDPLCGFEEDLTDLLMGVCALGWLQAGDLMHESESNYQGCKQELETYL